MVERWMEEITKKMTEAQNDKSRRNSRDVGRNNREFGPE